MRQSAAENKIVQFPTERSAGRRAMIEEEMTDQDRRMPIGLCMMIWTALAVAGWGAFGAAFKFI